MRKTALRRMQRVHTVGTTISVTISMWLISGSRKKKTKVRNAYTFSENIKVFWTENVWNVTSSALYLNFIMHRPNLWHICMFLIFLGFSSSWKGKQKKIPVRKLPYNFLLCILCLVINGKCNLWQNFLLFAPARSPPAVLPGRERSQQQLH